MKADGEKREPLFLPLMLLSGSMGAGSYTIFPNTSTNRAYAPHRQIDVKDLGVDLYAFSWYKVYGPHIASTSPLS